MFFYVLENLEEKLQILTPFKHVQHEMIKQLGNYQTKKIIIDVIKQVLSTMRVTLSIILLNLVH